MDALEMLGNGNLMVIQTLENLPEVEWDMPGVRGTWSVKDVLSHLTFYQYVTADVLRSLIGDEPTSYLNRWLSEDNEELNRTEVEERGGATAQQVLMEYEEIEAEVERLLKEVPGELVDKKGVLSWYGEDRSLLDLIRGMYEHTQKHCEEIKVFRARVKE